MIPKYSIHTGAVTDSLTHILLKTLDSSQPPRTEDNSTQSCNSRFSNRDGDKEAKLTDCSFKLDLNQITIDKCMQPIKNKCFLFSGLVLHAHKQEKIKKYNGIGIKMNKVYLISFLWLHHKFKETETAESTFCFFS